MDDLAKHNSDSSLWIAIDGTVYDITNFASKHPGGKAILMSVGGRDATKKFNVLHEYEVLRDALAKGLVVEKGKLASSSSSSAVSASSLVNVTPASLKAPLPVSESKMKHFASIKRAGMVRRVLDSILGIGNDVSQIASNTVIALGLNPLWDTQKKLFPIRGFPTPKDGTKTRVAVIGGGCSGCSAMWCLEQTEGFDVTLFEKKSELGGHSYTFPYDAEKHGGGKSGQPVVDIDMGYIFGNYRSVRTFSTFYVHY